MAISDPFRGTPLRSSGTRMRGAKAVLETLKAFQTDFFFGVPGSTMPIFAGVFGRTLQPS